MGHRDARRKSSVRKVTQYCTGIYIYICIYTRVRYLKMSIIIRDTIEDDNCRLYIGMCVYICEIARLEAMKNRTRRYANEEER